MNGEALYSVKWYKDGFEFYRYVPRDHPPAQVFDQSGIYVDVSIYLFTDILKADTETLEQVL